MHRKKHKIVTGGLLGDAWLEKTGTKVRFGIAQSACYKDVMQIYYDLLYGLGYITKYKPLNTLSRNKQLKNGLTKVDYYQLLMCRFFMLFSMHLKRVLGLRPFKCIEKSIGCVGFLCFFLCI
jgi:hypothetical protein